MTLVLKTSPSIFGEDLVDQLDMDNRPLGIEGDVLAKSCKVHRHYTSETLASYSVMRWHDLSEVQPDAVDLDQADQIRYYYYNQLLMMGLANKPLTMFKQRLMGVVDRSRDLVHQDIGILYRLPYFYVEDTARDRLRETYPSSAAGRTHIPSCEDRPLRAVERILVSRRHNERDEFWFADQNNELVMWWVQKTNPLLSMVESIFKHSVKTQTSVRLKGYYYQQCSRHLLLGAEPHTYWDLNSAEIVL
jgi:hypothetical protein